VSLLGIELAPGIIATNMREIHNDTEDGYPVDLCVGEVDGKRVAIVVEPSESRARIISGEPNPWCIKLKGAARLLLIPRGKIIEWCKTFGVDLQRGRSSERV